MTATMNGINVGLTLGEGPAEAQTSLMKEFDFSLWEPWLRGYRNWAECLATLGLQFLLPPGLVGARYSAWIFKMQSWICTKWCRHQTLSIRALLQHFLLFRKYFCWLTIVGQRLSGYCPVFGEAQRWQLGIPTKFNDTFPLASCHHDC